MDEEFPQHVSNFCSTLHERFRVCLCVNAIQRYFLNLTAAHNSHSPFHRLNGNVSLVATALLSFDVKYCSLDAIN